MQDKKLIFEKRMDIWNEYRNSITSESIKNEEWIKNNKKIKNFISSINSIDKSILMNFNFNANDVKLAEVTVIDPNSIKSLEQSYEILKFNFPNLSNSFIDNIKNEVSKIKVETDQKIFLTNNKELNLEKLEEFNELEKNHLVDIKNNMIELEKKIQMFPSDANDKLKKLTQTIRESNNIKSDSFVSIETKNIKPSFNLKISYFVILILLGVFILCGLLGTIIWLVI